jgi:hypothetical protein
MIYTVVVKTPFSDEEADEEYGERSFEVQAGSPNEALFKAEQRISKNQETIIKVEYAGED